MIIKVLIVHHSKIFVTTVLRCCSMHRIILLKHDAFDIKKLNERNHIISIAALSDVLVTVPGRQQNPVVGNLDELLAGRPGCRRVGSDALREGGVQALRACGPRGDPQHPERE